MFKTIEWMEDGVRMIDQLKLPNQEIYRTCRDYKEVAEAIRSMAIRGAPAIGVAAAMGIALGLKASEASTAAELRSDFERVAGTISSTRPTAVNLFWAVERMRKAFEAALVTERVNSRLSRDMLSRIQQCLVQECQRVLAEDIAVNHA